MKLDSTALAILIGLFIILSPGLILTIPGLSQSNITDKGVSYGLTPVTLCTASSTAESQCKKPTQVLTSGYTSVTAVLVHTLVFAVLLYILPPALGLRQPSAQAVIGAAVLFLLLSPGLILTLPPLTAGNCGYNNQNIADDSGGGVLKYCYADAGTGADAFPPGQQFTSATTPNCQKCTSWWASGYTGFLPIVVHAAVFGLLAYIAALYLL